MADRISLVSVPRIYGNQNTFADNLTSLPSFDSNLGYPLIHRNQEHCLLLPALLHRLTDRRLVNVANILPPIPPDNTDYSCGRLRQASTTSAVHFLDFILQDALFSFSYHSLTILCV